MQLTGILLLLAVADGSNALRAEYHVDFRHGKFDDRQLGLTNPGAAKHIKPGPSGLLITIPADVAMDTAGFDLKYAVHGDFEITASYEILDVATPDFGYGVGPVIHIVTSTGAENAATLSRFERVAEGSVYGAHVAWSTKSWTSPPKREHRVRLLNTSAESGRLRLVRSGKTLRFLAADGESETFRRLRQVDFTDGRVELVRVALNRNGAQTPATVLWKDFDLRAEKISHPSRSSSTGVWLFMAGLCVTGILGALGTRYWRRAKSAQALTGPVRSNGLDTLA